MLFRHGISHSLALVCCTIVGALLVHVVSPYFPDVRRSLEGIAERIVDSLGLSIDPQFIVIMIIAMVLAFLWGLVFEMRTR